MEYPDPTGKKVYVVEHLDPELGPWSTLEYLAIAQESKDDGVSFCLSSVSAALDVPLQIRTENGIIIERRGAEEIFAGSKDRVCLLDPAAPEELSPRDSECFDIFLFGGILGIAHMGPLTRECRD